MTISNLYPTTNPSLLLDFANVKGLDPRVSFTRNSPATYWDSTGVLRTARVNQPRFDHDPVTLKSRGLLVEQSATNLLTYSEEFNNAAWTKQECTVVSNAALAPTGTSAATKLVESTGIGFGHRIYTTNESKIVRCGSVYVKSAERTKVGFGCQGGLIINAKFDLVTGSLISASNGVVAQNVGNGWWRLSFSANDSASVLGPYVYILNDSGSEIYAGDGTSGIYIWGAQLEPGTRATSYIKTQATTVNREADVVSIGGTNFTRWYESDEGTLVVQSATPDWGLATNVSLDDGTTSNQILVNWDGIASPTAIVNRNGNSQTQIQNAYTTADPDVTLVTTINNYSVGLAFNGVDVGTTTSSTVPTVNQMRIGVDTPQAWFKRIMFYRQAKDSVKIRALSSSSNVAVDLEPISLFKSGEPGVWFDPADVANLDWRRNLLTNSDAALTQPNLTYTPIGSTLETETSLSSSRTNAVTGNIFLKEDGSTGAHERHLPRITLITSTYTFSFLVERRGSARNLSFNRRSTGSFGVTFDFDSLTAGSLAGSATSASIQQITTGVFLCSLTYNETVGGLVDFRFALLNGVSSSYTGDNTSGLLIYTVQLELGSTATEYQPIPSDLNTELRTRFPNATLFTDTAGTAPVKTPGESVALMLDKSRGLALGPDMWGEGINNGTAGYASYTPSTDTWEIYRDASGSGRVRSAATFQPFTTLAVEFDFAARSGSTPAIDIRIDSGTGGRGYANLSNPANGRVRVIIATGNVTTAISFNCPNVGFGYFISNVSVRELFGNHAIQETAASRPIYSVIPQTGRRNLLTYSEQMDNAVWVKGGVSVSANAAIAPDRTATADLLTGTGATPRVYQLLGGITNGGTYTASVYVKQGTSTGITFDAINIQSGPTFTFATKSWSAATANILSTAFDELANGWFRLKVTFLSNTTSAGPGWAVSGTTTAYIWGAQLEVGSTATAYQRVGSQYDVTESGVTSLHYLSFDGTDDFMVTSTITPNTDKVQVFAGVRKLTDANYPLVVEFSTSANSNNGAFNVIASGATVNTAGWSLISRGTTSAQAQVGSGYSSQITNVLTGLGDIAGDATTLRVNSMQVAKSAADQGTGNYLAYPLYIGRRGGTSLPFNGHLYGLIVRFGSNLNTPTIQRTEAILGTKSGFNWNNLISTTIYDRSDTTILDRAGNTIMERT